VAKNMLEDFPYVEYHSLLANALQNDIHIVHTNFIKGGYTFAWRRMSEFAKGRMIEVSVSFCSPRDSFCRKIGTLHALSNFEDGARIQVPAGSEDASVIIHRLRAMFYESSYNLYFRPNNN